jgi:hypothetical protein
MRTKARYGSADDLAPDHIPHRRQPTTERRALWGAHRTIVEVPCLFRKKHGSGFMVRVYLGQRKVEDLVERFLEVRHVAGE